MNLNNTYTGHAGIEYTFAYTDASDFDALDPNVCTQTYAVCFCDERIVIGYNGAKKTWGLIGGDNRKRRNI